MLKDSFIGDLRKTKEESFVAITVLSPLSFDFFLLQKSVSVC